MLSPWSLRAEVWLPSVTLSTVRVWVVPVPLPVVERKAWCHCPSSTRMAWPVRLEIRGAMCPVYYWA